MVTAFHSGDLGDVIFAIPSMLELGVTDCYLNTRGWTKEMTPARFGVIKPLLENAGIVAHHGECGKYDVDFSTFRGGGMPWGVSICDLQSRWVLKKAIEYKPWLSFEPDAASEGRILLHRSPRYRNPYFDWKAVAQACGDRVLSVCPTGEHEELEAAAGRPIEQFKVSDFVQLGRLIAGADAFIGNQSSPMALALAMGVSGAQETCLWIPDCVYPIEGMHFSSCGEVPFLGVGPRAPMLDKGVVPPGNWKHPKGSCISFRQACRDSGLTEDEVIRMNTDRVAIEKPGWFGGHRGKGNANPYPTKNLIAKIKSGGIMKK